MSKTTLQFIATGLVMMLFGITMVVVGTINDFLTSEYQVDKLFIGFCASMLTSGILAGSFLFGSAAERFGYKRIMLLGVLMVIAGIAGIVQFGHITVIPYLFLLIGLGGGIINGVTNLVVAVLYPVNTGAWLSLLGVFYGVGAFGLPLLTSVLLEQGWEYRSILTWIGVSLLIPFVFVLVLRFPEAKRSGGIAMKAYFKFFTHPAVLFIGMFLFFQSAVEAIVPTWTPTYLKETFRVEYSDALYAITVSCISIAVARLFLSQILKKVSSFRVVLASLFIVIAGIALLEVSGSFRTGLAGVALIGLGLAASFPVMLDYTAGKYPDHTGTVFSIVIGIALTGNILLNLLTGYILQSFGVNKLNSLLILFVLIMIALLYAVNYRIIKK